VQWAVYDQAKPVGLDLSKQLVPHILGGNEQWADKNEGTPVTMIAARLHNATRRSPSQGRKSDWLITLPPGSLKGGNH